MTLDEKAELAERLALLASDTMANKVLELYPDGLPKDMPADDLMLNAVVSLIGAIVTLKLADLSKDEHGAYASFVLSAVLNTLVEVSDGAVMSNVEVIDMTDVVIH